MSKFQVGDRVRVVKDDADNALVKAGDVGTVVGESDSKGYDVVVLMDEPRHRGTRSKTEDGDEYDWYFRDQSLELVGESTGPHLSAELVSGDSLAEALAKAAREHNVLVSVTFAPYDFLTEDE